MLVIVFTSNPLHNRYCFGKKSVISAINAIKRGELVCVVDDMSRENEGDLITASDVATPSTMARMIRHTSGVLCVAMEGDRMDSLNLPPMCVTNEDPKGTAFSVSVDATKVPSERAKRQAPWKRGRKRGANDGSEDVIEERSDEYYASSLSDEFYCPLANLFDQQSFTSTGTRYHDGNLGD